MGHRECHDMSHPVNKGSSDKKNFTRKVFKNAKPFLNLLIFWLGIFKINSKIISSQMIGKIISKNDDFWKMGHNFGPEFSKLISTQKLKVLRK